MDPSVHTTSSITGQPCTDSSTELTDRSLLRRFRKGEEDAATQLYLRYARRLTAFAARQTAKSLQTRFDAEDVIQSVFRTFFRRAADGSVDVPPSEELWQLLLVIALNKVRRWGRFHRQQRRNVDQTVGSELATEPVKGDTESSLAMLEMVIDEALEGFPPIQREMIELRIQGYPIPEIAERTGRCRRTIERVLRQFRDCMSDYVDRCDENVDT